jgi:uncharacterized protein GlcG (DUF336 family)
VEITPLACNNQASSMSAVRTTGYFRTLSRRWIMLQLLASLVACTSGCSEGNITFTLSSNPDTGDCTDNCMETGSFLSIADVEQIIAQAVAEALLHSLDASIAIVDRVGNALAVFHMGPSRNITINSGRTPPVSGGLEGLTVDSTLAAITKAITGAYFSTEGNAFTTRTANQIIHEHFNPGESGQPGGPLFGVQFSQLPCSDLSSNLLRTGTGGNITPRSSPLGLSADPGGLPIYKEGTVVGGIGVISDGLYGLDLNINDTDSDADELIALAGQSGYEPPEDIRADRITIDGKTLRYVDDTNLLSTPASTADFNSIVDILGSLVAVAGYFDGNIIDGVEFATPDSGIEADLNIGNLFPGLDAFVLTDGTGTNRYPPVAGTQLTAQEVTVLLRNALEIANKTRAQIRRPLGSQARVSISVVDTNGDILGIVRTRDAPIFGTDVSLQKARTATFFSNPGAAVSLTTAGFGGRVADIQAFVGPTALTDGIAFSDRAGGNLSRPFFPDGIDGMANGPFSNPFPDWSPFSDGLQLELIIAELSAALAGTINSGCGTISGLSELDNGMQIFPGSVPIYRGNTLVGGIGISGDGVDQDDMIAFLAVDTAAQTENINNAPPAIRADTLATMGVSLRYVQCPQTPFLNSNEQNVCAGK